MEIYSGESRLHDDEFNYKRWELKYSGKKTVMESEYVIGSPVWLWWIWLHYVQLSSYSWWRDSVSKRRQEGVGLMEVNECILVISIHIRQTKHFLGKNNLIEIHGRET